MKPRDSQEPVNTETKNDSQMSTTKQRRSLLVRQKHVDSVDIGMTRAVHLEDDDDEYKSPSDKPIFTIGDTPHSDPRVPTAEPRDPALPETSKTKQHPHMIRIHTKSEGDLMDPNEHHMHRAVETHIVKGFQNIRNASKNVLERTETILFEPEYDVHFGFTDYLSVVVSIVGFCLDLGSDISVAYFLSKEQDTHWWYIDILFYGTKSRKQPSREVLGPYCVIDKSGKKKKMGDTSSGSKVSTDATEATEKVDYRHLLIWEERDSAMLDMLHSMLGDAPQLVLQIYILIRRPPNTGDHSEFLEVVNIEIMRNGIPLVLVLVQTFSVASSLFSLSWSLASYSGALRFAIPEKKNLNMCGKLLQFMWKFFTVGVRVVAMALFASVYRGYLIVGIAGHWAIMSLWIFYQVTSVVLCDLENFKNFGSMKQRGMVQKFLAQ
ncbi:unnamed protein product [Notodromas monacha]|uniref:XK-related protein n=1 Tax=Notodromas monacha TaxID=399045 RepID=A0A7R9BYM9_9CRUS|nr:unnamed protein product [Notodromas monacha]CAG0923796.1 unnamed protein product [Notodromas monacha]